MDVLKLSKALADKVGSVVQIQADEEAVRFAVIRQEVQVSLNFHYDGSRYLLHRKDVPAKWKRELDAALKAALKAAGV